MFLCTSFHLCAAKGVVGPLIAAVLLALFPISSVSAQQALYDLEVVERIGADILKGPGDVAADKQGNIFTGCEDGVIYKISPEGGISRFASTKGRPLGLSFSPDGDLLVCDAGRREVLSITPAGMVSVIARSTDTTQLVHPTDITAAKDGSIYFVDASTYPLGKGVQDLMRDEPLGRVLCIRPDKTTEVLKKDLYFPHGVALSPDEAYLYVAETPKSRIQRITLTGAGKGDCQVFVDELPGLVAGITMCKDGTILAAIPLISKEGSGVDSMPSWKRGWLSRLPRWSAAPPSLDEGMILRINPDKKVDVLLTDPKGVKIAGVSNVIIADGFCYLGFFQYGKGIARFRQ